MISAHFKIIQRNLLEVKSWLFMLLKPFFQLNIPIIYAIFHHWIAWNKNKNLGVEVACLQNVKYVSICILLILSVLNYIVGFRWRHIYQLDQTKKNLVLLLFLVPRFTTFLLCFCFWSVPKRIAQVGSSQMQFKCSSKLVIIKTFNWLAHYLIRLEPNWKKILQKSRKRIRIAKVL